MDAPSDLSTWFGALVLTNLITGAVASFVKRGTQNDAEFRALTLANDSRILEKLSAIELTSGRHDERIARLQVENEQIRIRADRQAEEHRKEIDRLQTRIGALEATDG